MTNQTRVTTTVSDVSYDGPDLCPMGCGRTTDDPYGGPCSACWEAIL